MKPRIRKVRGVWMCALQLVSERYWVKYFASPHGHGYTPQEAYDDWKEQVNA